MNRKEALISELISKVLGEYIFEEDNPFAVKDDKKGEEEVPAPEADAEGADKKAEEKPKAEPKQDAGLTFNFDISGVKKYNKANFGSSTAVAKKITKDGIIATVQPDGIDILVGFDDVSESVKAFFKAR